MGLIFKLFLLGGVLSAVWVTVLWHQEIPIPQLKDEWWAEGKPVSVDETVKPFSINIPDSVS